MSEEDINSNQDRRQSVSLQNLLLDPNNYRFRDADSYVTVEENDVAKPDVQRRTSGLLLGRNAENIRDLNESFKKNGFLPVDQIQVRRIKDSSKYIVVEGNRRVATLKYLQSRYSNEGFDLGRLDPGIFKKIPVVYYNDADEAHHLILMGLKHISGNKKWPPINQAELVRSLHEEHNMSIDDICHAIGISKQEANSTLQTLALIDTYLKSDYSDQFESNKYSIFREIIRNRRINNWLEWNRELKEAKNKNNLDRIFSWISEEHYYEHDKEDDPSQEPQRLGAVLAQSSQIRELAKIIDDEKALNNLDTTRNLSDATLSSEVLSKDRIKNALSLINQEANIIFNMSNLITDSDRAKIQELDKKLSGIINLSNTQDISTALKKPTPLTKGSEKFSSIHIEKFRALKNISLEGLSRINILAGLNNSGKTTALEAIKLLCSLNNTSDFINLIKTRAKVCKDDVHMQWFVDQLPTAKLTATFDNLPISMRINSEETPQDDLTQYLTSATFSASLENRQLNSQIHFFEKYPQRTEGETGILCRSTYSTPFSVLEPKLLSECHSESLKEGSKEKIIDFIKDHIDPAIKNIEMNENGYFTVMHNEIKPNPDLTKFGEGLQRIFKIGLLFSGARNGVVIIDEFENAIHTSLLGHTVTLLNRLAEQFNVQIFISSHSKECINAFVQNDTLPTNSVSAYTLIQKDGETICQHFPGNRLERLINLIDFDLRGGPSE